MSVDKQELLSALKVVIDYLDSMMEEAPNRQLADVSNYLEEVKAKLS